MGVIIYIVSIRAYTAIFVVHEALTSCPRPQAVQCVKVSTSQAWNAKALHL